MVNYQKSVIYTITTRGQVYVGSTVNFANRKWQHKDAMKRHTQRLLYRTIIANDYEWDMKPYKLFPCESSMELQIEEERVRKELNSELNMHRCYRTPEELTQQNRQKCKRYGDRNRDKTKERNRQYYQQNKDKNNERCKQYQEKNRDKINERRREKRKQAKLDKMTESVEL